MAVGSTFFLFPPSDALLYLCARTHDYYDILYIVKIYTEKKVDVYAWWRHGFIYINFCPNDENTRA